MSRVLVAGSTIALVVILAVAWLGLSHLHQTAGGPPAATQTKERSHEELLQAIVRDRPTLAADGQPVIKVAAVTRLEQRWYVVTIKSVHATQSFVPVKVLVMDSGAPSYQLQTMLGPDVYFSASQVAAINAPDSVLQELNKS